MKKKVLSAILSVAMVAALLVGCGNAAEETNAPAETEASAEEEAEASAEEAEAPAEEASGDGPVYAFVSKSTRSTRDRQQVLRKQWQTWAAKRSFSIRNPLQLTHRSQ